MNWTKDEYTLAWLGEYALDVPDCFDGPVFGWLKVIGVVPAHVESMKPVIPLIDTDPNRLKAGYLAASAFEWDTWGKSMPIDFVKAIGLECRGVMGRDLIAETLTALGRQVAAAGA